MNYNKFLKKETDKLKKDPLPEEDIQEYKAMVVDEINSKVASNERKGLAESLGLAIGVHLDTNAKHRILNGDNSAWVLIEQQTYWMAHIIEKVPGSIHMDSRNYGGILGMSMLWGYDDLAALIAADAERAFQKDREKFERAQAIHVFMASLYRKYKDGTIPEYFSILPPDHIYQRLIASWQDEAAYAKLMPEVCDYHLYSAYDDGKNKMLEILTFDLIPFDIRTIELVRKKEGLPTPAIDHPLLKTPLADIPAQRPGYDPASDEILQLVLKNEK